MLHSQLSDILYPSSSSHYFTPLYVQLLKGTSDLSVIYPSSQKDKCCYESRTKTTKRRRNSKVCDGSSKLQQGSKQSSRKFVLIFEGL